MEKQNGRGEEDGVTVGAGLRGYRDLKAYQLAYRLAQQVFNVSKSFSNDERVNRTLPPTAFCFLPTACSIGLWQSIDDRTQESVDRFR